MNKHDELIECWGKIKVGYADEIFEDGFLSETINRTADLLELYGNALDAAAYALFQVKRMGANEAIINHVRIVHEKACKVLDANDTVKADE